MIPTLYHCIVWRDSLIYERDDLVYTRDEIIAAFNLSKYIMDNEDALIIFKSRQEKWLEKEYLGIKEDATDNFIKSVVSVQNPR